MRNTGATLTTPELLAKCVALHADLAAVLDESRGLCGQGLQLAIAAYPRIWPISGGSADVELITLIITDASLCAECIAKKTGVLLRQVEPILVRIGKTVRVFDSGTPCDACLTTRKVFRLV